MRVHSMFLTRGALRAIGLRHCRWGSFRRRDPVQFIFSVSQIKGQFGQALKLANHMFEIAHHQWNVLRWRYFWVGLHELIHANFDHRDGYVDSLTLRTKLFGKCKRCTDRHGRKKGHHRPKNGVACFQAQRVNPSRGNHLVVQTDRQLAVDEMRSENNELAFSGLLQFAYTKLVGSVCKMHSAETYRPSAERSNDCGRDGDCLVRCDTWRPGSDDQQSCRDADYHRERQENSVENPLHHFFPLRVIGMCRYYRLAGRKPCCTLYCRSGVGIDSLQHVCSNGFR